MGTIFREKPHEIALYYILEVVWGEWQDRQKLHDKYYSTLPLK